MTDLERRAAEHLGERLAELTRLPGGGNNRVFEVHTPGGARALLKCYFRHADDPRDRLDSEFRFLTYAWSEGIRCVPEPLARDDELGFGLYEFVDGRRATEGDVTAEAVSVAAGLVADLNLGAPDLPPASEACFTVADHLDLVQGRVDALVATGEAWVAERLVPTWQRVRDQVLASAGAAEAAEPLVSPSDFGFHNVLVRTDDSLCFVDFEYAGMDDGAKLAGDFFSQVALPVPDEHWDAFVSRTLDPPARSRAELLLPVYRVKWACIVLNELLPTGVERRRFAGEETGEQRKRERLALAGSVLDRVG